MATMRFDVATNSFTKTVSPADLGRLNVACRVAFGMSGGATDAQVAAALATWLWAQLKGLVKAQEQAAAVKTAADGVSDIGLT